LIGEIKKSLRPYTVLFFGINGSGKTTSIAKLAHKLKKEGISCVLAAGDTFRAAAIDQLEEHAKKLNVPIIKKDYGSDPAAVAFDAISYAKKNKVQAVLIDTAGRMYTASNLLKEMEKIVRISKPDLKLFVGESITGNDATEQARTFNDSVGIDGLILSKADIDEKAGTILSVSQVTGKPIYFLGMGQSYEDLQTFSKKTVLKNLGLE
jgi:fused signal recognition particle receptor